MSNFLLVRFKEKLMKKQEKGLIVCDPKILNGKPTIKGTRISVALILQNIASGMTREEILLGYPTLAEEGLDAALDLPLDNSREKRLMFLQIKSNHENTRR